MKTELKIQYDEMMRPVSATCTACGEKMPKSPGSLKDSADIVMWLSKRYIEHKTLKHNAPQIT